jgi:hypothetical protein
MFDKPYIQTSNPNKQQSATIALQRTIYYGEVMSIDDDSDGGRIKVKIPDLDNRTSNIDDLPWCYPLIPRFIYQYPQVGEMVRVLIEDIKLPMRSRFWTGSVISQSQKIGFDSKFTATSTTNYALVNPEKAVSTYPDADGVFPIQTDIAIIGRINTDVILRINEVHIRAGKHENDNILKLNTKNPAEISMVFEPINNNNNTTIINNTSTCYYSNTIIASDKIAIISHTGNPQFKAARLTADDRTRIFNEGHPLGRGDIIVEALNVLRDAIINHIHGYSNLSADKNEIIRKLEQLQLDQILQKNIVIN